MSVSKLSIFAVAAVAASTVGFRVLAQPPAVGRGGGGFGGQPDPIDFNNHAGFAQIFDGITLSGWDGNPAVWKVENGAIVGTSTVEKPTGTTFIIWRGGEPADFEMKVELKQEGVTGNTGIQYRSLNITPTFGRGPGGAGGGGRGASGAGGGRGAGALGGSGGGRGRGPVIQNDPRWDLSGYQADFDFVNRFSGQLVDTSSTRFILTPRGAMVDSQEGMKGRLVGSLGNVDELAGYVKINDWNQYHLIIKGNTLIHILNGHVMAITLDNDAKLRTMKGLIGFQIESNGDSKVSFRNIWLKTL
jgi:hypothetical protein